jgi:hypothetical protein
MNEIHNSTIQWKKRGVELLPPIIQGVIQNRVTLVWFILLASSPFHQELVLLAFNTVVGLSQIGLTWIGTSTNAVYQKTCRHIEKHNTLDEIFFNAVVSGGNWEYHWYCELQWIYLACKKHGIEDLFFQLKKMHSKNKIPNF